MKRPYLSRHDRVLWYWHKSGIVKTTQGAFIDLKICWLRLLKEISKKILI